LLIRIKIEDLYKEYRLGSIGYGTLREDIQRWGASIRGKPDPNSIINYNGRNSKYNLNRILALNNINLEVKQGERLGIIGKNGAGKTTLLKILSRISSPTKGSIKIKGRVASLIAIGTGFHSELTGRENIYLNGAILGLNKREIDKRYDEIIDFSGVEKFIDTPVKRYSSGMYVRLGFSVAAHLDPDILIVDEVLAVGDEEFRKQAFDKMVDVSESGGRTIIFVSHNLVSVKNLCSRTIVLNNGKITFNGDTGEAIDHYLDTADIKESVSIDKEFNREGMGNIRLNRVVIANEARIQTGKEFIVRISFNKLSDDLLVTQVGLSIWKEDGTRLISINTDMNREIIDNNLDSIQCCIPIFPLVAGRYQLNIVIYSLNGIEDYVVGAKKIHIHPSDYYGNGKTVNPNYGSIIVDHEWTQ